MDIENLKMEENHCERIQDIYEIFTKSSEYNEILMNHDLDIDWLQEKLGFEDYRKLEDYILCFSSKKDELLFELGFKYAWSLFSECAKGTKDAGTAKCEG